MASTISTMAQIKCWTLAFRAKSFLWRQSSPFNLNSWVKRSRLQTPCKCLTTLLEIKEAWVQQWKAAVQPSTKLRTYWSWSAQTKVRLSKWQVVLPHSLSSATIRLLQVKTSTKSSVYTIKLPSKTWYRRWAAAVHTTQRVVARSITYPQPIKCTCLLWPITWRTAALQKLQMTRLIIITCLHTNRCLTLPKVSSIHWIWTRSKSNLNKFRKVKSQKSWTQKLLKRRIMIRLIIHL